MYEKLKYLIVSLQKKEYSIDSYKGSAVVAIKKDLQSQIT